jgi:hypothetical protein
MRFFLLVMFVGSFLFAKCCRKCYIKSKEKSLDEIKEYRRFWHTKKKYNITKEDFNITLISLLLLIIILLIISLMTLIL